MNILVGNPVMLDYPRSILEFQRRFADEATCARYLADQRWPDGFCCPPAVMIGPGR